MTLRPALTLFLLTLFMQARVYYPTTIDRIKDDPHTYVSVRGIVTSVSVTQSGDTTFRIRDAQYRSLGCTIPKNTLPQPRVGTLVNVSGVKDVIVLNDRPNVIEIDPVQKIEPVE